MAKALSGGYLPVGATLGRDEIFAEVYSSMDRVLVHDSTFGANAQAMATGLATLHVLEHEDVVENARVVGAELLRRLTELLPRYELLHEVRGKGLMIGIEFGPPTSSLKLRAHWRALQLARRGLFAQTVVHALFHRHRILTQVSGYHIKLIPPLIIGEAEVEKFVAAFVDVMDDAHAGFGLTRAVALVSVSSRRRADHHPGGAVDPARRGARVRQSPAPTRVDRHPADDGRHDRAGRVAGPAPGRRHRRRDGHLCRGRRCHRGDHRAARRAGAPRRPDLADRLPGHGDGHQLRAHRDVHQGDHRSSRR